MRTRMGTRSLPGTNSWRAVIRQTEIGFMPSWPSPMGEPVVSWMPDLGTARNYMVEGKANLPDEGVWSAQTTPGMRFFRVRVGLPE